MIGVMTTASTTTEPAAAAAAPPDPDKAAARAASQALAAQLLRRVAARWPNSDQITVLGRQLTASIDRYERSHRQPPTWADALAGVDPSLLAPLHAIPEGWPRQPARWRLELRQHLMRELKRTSWITYTRTPRSLQTGDQGRGWRRTLAVLDPQHHAGDTGPG